MRSYRQRLISFGFSMLLGHEIALSASIDHPEQEAPSPKRILILGDSHATGGFGEQLHANLAQTQRYHVYTFALCGASFDTFLAPLPRSHCGHIERVSDPKITTSRFVVDKPYPNHSTANNLDDHIARFRPSIIIGEIGMNLGYQSKEQISQQLIRFISHIRTKGVEKFILVGPPMYYQAEHIETAFLAALKEAEFGQYISSLDFNRDQPIDAKLLHLSTKKSRQWGDFTYRRLLPLLDDPPNAKTKPDGTAESGVLHRMHEE